MTIEFLKKIENIDKDIKDLRKRLDALNIKQNKIVTDSVKGSEKEYPYIEHNFKVEGVSIFTPKNKKLKNKYKKMLKSKKYKLEKLKVQLEYELNYIDDSEILKIIRFKYIDGLTWLQVMFEMGYSSESKAKMKLKRFFKKNNKCDKCDEKK